MRIIYSVTGVLFIALAVVIYAFGPLVDFADSLSVERFVVISTTALGLLGVALIVMGCLPPRRRKRARQSDHAAA